MAIFPNLPCPITPRLPPLSLLLGFALLTLISPAYGTSNPWIRPTDTSAPLIWGHNKGVVFGLPSTGGLPGPRGLIRVGVLSTTGAPVLINFIAVEPVVKGTGPRHTRMGFSELEKSQLDGGREGKRIWSPDPFGTLVRSTSTTSSVERLTVRVEVEPFTANSAHVYLLVSISSDRPDEIEVAVHHQKDSAPIEELTVTATMGNYMRVRHLWLADQVIDSRQLYEGYSGNDFIEHEVYPLRKMLYWQGDPIILATTNEVDPASVLVRPHSWWNYKSHKMTQYWRVPKQHVQPDLRSRVNGRRVYWNSTNPIPGGPSFENLEVRQKYEPGQVFVFGLTRDSPCDFQPPIPALPSFPR